MHKNIGILKRLKHTVPKNVLKIIYHWLITPHLNYGILLWGFNLDRIEKLQKQAIRIITRSYFLAHTSNLFKQTKILKIEDIFKLKQILFYHKFVINKLPYSIENILTKQLENRRACHAAFFLKPPAKVNTESAKQCIRYSIPTLINNYHDRNFIESIHSLSVLSIKNHFKKMSFENYSFYCSELNCYPCSSRFFNSFGFSGILKYIHIFYYLTNFKFQKTTLTSGFLAYLNIFQFIAPEYMETE